MKTTIFTGAVSASLIAAAAHADFRGFVAFVRQQGPNTVIDVFAGVSNPNDRLLNCYNRSISTSLPAGFVQQAGTATRGWKPDAASSTRSNGVDSFMTIGVQDGSAYAGEYYASGSTGADGAFTNWTSNGASTVPPLAGWFISPPTLPDNVAESLAGMPGTRVNLSGGSTANYGVWCAHLVLANTASSYTVNFGGQASVRDGVTNTLSQTASSGTITVTPDADGDGVPDAVDACPSVAGAVACNGCPTNVCGSCGDAPDADNDGKPDCQDNCPSVANPSQADCDADGQGDACEGAPDCNANGRPDSCDIAAGSSNDVDGNGVPDECQPDCNLNGLPDAWEIATGRVTDLDADGIPDNCQGARMVHLESSNLGAPSGAAARVWNVAELLPSETNVTITVDLRGDLDGQTEWVDVVLNGGAPRRFFDTTGNDCPSTPDRAVISLSRGEFNALIGSGQQLVVRVEAPSTVDPSECKDGGLTVISMSYVGIEPAGDCNDNLRLDVVETAEGSTPDCNGNKVPDSCDIARGVGTDCNADGVIDSCQIAANPAIDCNGNGVIDTCDVATGGSAVDCDGNGRIDSCQVLENPSQDCNANGKPDSCDLAAGGTSVDCDQNGRLDSCQVLENPSQDCNSNGKPDSCDVSSGASADRDANGTPDECQTVNVPGQFPTIQAAIDAAPTNVMRIVKVAAGTFNERIAFNGKPVVVQGTGAGQTVITAAGTGGASLSVVRFTGGEPAIAALERVTVRGGQTGTPFPGFPSSLVGGGVFLYQTAASVRDCTVEGNVSGSGGGIYAVQSTGSISNCTVRNNLAGSGGGGIQIVSSPMRVSDTVVETNDSVSVGGGMVIGFSQPVLQRCVIRNNRSSNAGGGIWWKATADPAALLTMESCELTGNVSDTSAGGIAVIDDSSVSKLSLQSTTVCGNTPRPNVSGRWTNLGGNQVCDCAGDLSADGVVNGADLGLLLAAWGPCSGGCQADLNADGVINGADLGALLATWGPCGN